MQARPLRAASFMAALHGNFLLHAGVFQQKQYGGMEMV